METVITLLIAGVVLLLLETVLPGMIAGAVGFCCLVAGVFLGYKQGVQIGNIILFGVVSGLIVLALVWIKYFPQSRVGRIFVSQQTVGEIGTRKPELLHQTGAALSHLRPSGTALINGKRVDVITEGSHIERGTPVRVVALEGMRVVVRAI